MKYLEKNRMKLRSLIFIFMISGLSACGFQLRGNNLQGLQDTSFHVQSNGANRLASEVRQQLSYAGVVIADSASDAQYIIKLSSESFSNKVLSVSPDTGKVEERELFYSANIAVVEPNGKTLLKPEPVTASRDLTIDQGAILSKFDESSILGDDMVRQAAARALRRVRTVIQ